MSGMIASENISPVSGVEPSPEHMETEEYFDGWPDAESALDERPEDDAEEAQPETEAAPEEEEGATEETEQEAAEESEQGEEDVEQYDDVGRSGKKRITQLLAERNSLRSQVKTFEQRLSAMEARSMNDPLVAELRQSRQIQAQAWEMAQRQREEQAKAQREAEFWERMTGQGYVATDFSHNVAVQALRKIEEFVESQKGHDLDQKFAEFERQRQAQSYMAQVVQNLDTRLQGLNVEPAMRQHLYEMSIEQAQLLDTTPDKAVEAALKRANAMGVVQKRKPAVKKPKAIPPKHVQETVASGANKSGRSKGPQTKAAQNKRARRDLEDQAFGGESGW